MRRILTSRFFIVPALLIAITIGWNIYVDLHAHGMLSGKVTDAAGNPVPGATVILSVHDFVTQVEKSRTKTDAAGWFHFTDNNSHLIQLEAQSGALDSPRITVRLWFRAQDRLLRHPLRLAPRA